MISLHSILEKEYSKRKDSNPSYSIRAFARFLKLDSSTLSQIMRGKRNLTYAMKIRIGSRLGLDPATLAEMNATKKEENKQGPGVMELELDAFHLISDWHHFAICELTSVKGFKNDPKWIGKQLGIPATVAEIALQRLLRMDLIRENPGSKKLETTHRIYSTLGYRWSDEALRKMQAQILSQAQHALETVDYSERDQSSITMAMDSKLIPEVREKIKKFRRDLCDFVQNRKSEKDSVYQLTIGCFPITSHKKLGEKK